MARLKPNDYFDWPIHDDVMENERFLVLNLPWHSKTKLVTRIPTLKHWVMVSFKYVVTGQRVV